MLRRKCRRGGPTGPNNLTKTPKKPSKAPKPRVHLNLDEGYYVPLTQHKGRQGRGAPRPRRGYHIAPHIGEGYKNATVDSPTRRIPHTLERRDPKDPCPRPPHRERGVLGIFATGQPHMKRRESRAQGHLQTKSINMVKQTQESLPCTEGYT